MKKSKKYQQLGKILDSVGEIPLDRVMEMEIDGVLYSFPESIFKEILRSATGLQLRGLLVEWGDDPDEWGYGDEYDPNAPQWFASELERRMTENDRE